MIDEVRLLERTLERNPSDAPYLLAIAAEINLMLFQLLVRADILELGPTFLPPPELPTPRLVEPLDDLPASTTT